MRNYDFAPPTERDIANRDKEIERLDAEVYELQSRRCETCKHWGTSKNREDWVIPVKKCGAIPAMFEVFSDEFDDDGNLIEKRTLPEEYASAKAFAQDGECYHATVWTLPDFGCVMHEAKGDDA